MVLVNGADGIGTGWSTKIPNYDIREIVANLKRLLDGLDPEPMVSFGCDKGTFQMVIFIFVPKHILWVRTDTASVKPSSIADNQDKDL